MEADAAICCTPVKGRGAETGSGSDDVVLGTPGSATPGTWSGEAAAPKVTPPSQLTAELMPLFALCVAMPVLTATPYPPLHTCSWAPLLCV